MGLNILFNRILYVGLFIIVVIFNPLTFPGLYIDSTGSFSFIATLKISLLIILNIVLLIIWILKIKQTKELAVNSSVMYIPLIFWITSVLVSFFMSFNKNLSFYGMNYTLEYSFVEAISIFVFLIILINNVRTKEDLETIIRSIILGLSVSFVYTLIRYSGKWTISNEPFSYYFNSNTFTLLGDYTALPTISLIGTILALGLVVSDIVYQKSTKLLVVDTIFSVINTVIFVVSLNLASTKPEYIHLITAIFIITLIIYIIFSYSRTNKSFIPIVAIVLIGIILGLGLYYGITKNTAQPVTYPSVSLDAAWNITLDAIKGSVQSGIFGIGYGSFGYAFDQFKNESIALPINNRDGQPVLTNFTINGQSPSTEEIRVYQPSSIILGIILAQGIFGVVSLVILAGLAIYVFINKRIDNLGIIGTISFIAYITSILLFIFTKYDFTTIFISWLCLGIFIISASVDEPYKNLVIALAGRHINFGTNFNYILPSLVVLSLGYLAFRIVPIFLANYYAYQAKLAQQANNLDAYIQNANLAFSTFPRSDIFIRESVFSRAVKLSDDIDEVLKKIKETNDKTNNDEINQRINEILAIQNILSRDLQLARVQNPLEYKNHYLEGLMLARVSELVKLQMDGNAIQYFQAALQRNPYHPESYYQIAKILYRSAEDDNNRIAARNAITLALRYRPVNLSYQALYADILKSLGSYDQALEIYKFIKQVKEANPDNESIKSLYENQQIEVDIEEIERNKINNPANSTSTEKLPTPSVTPKPSKNP